MRKKILIVDDEPEMVNMLKMRFEANNYEIASANDGEEALKKVEEFTPDLIILDLMLPKIDGYKVCTMLKQDEKYKKIPILMLTARSLHLDKVVGIECGAEGYVTKPFDAEVLLEKVRGLL